MSIIARFEQRLNQPVFYDTVRVNVSIILYWLTGV